ncbi:MAG: ASKHA domain-containing protein [Planctomycetota bacterium]|jgi:uncharacterized 2Fe-2S/4Fe-4S cluster protein (DUF4445 family)
MPTITFLPANKIIETTAGANLLSAAQNAGLDLHASCGGKGLCGKCRVRIKSGTAASDQGHENALSAAELKAGWRLACLVEVEGDMTVQIPESSTSTVTLVDFGATEVTPDAGIKAFPLDIPKPSLEDQAADMERLSRAIGREISPHSSLKLVQALPDKLRENDFKITAVMLEDELLGIEPYSEELPLLGLALDIGTTTVAGVLCDLQTGESLATASCTNPQAVHGDDVISRIEYTSKDGQELREMQKLIVEAINGIAKETTSACGMSKNNIYKISAAGNTTMHHLLLGISPQHIGVSPFIAARREAYSIRAHKVGIEIATGGRLYAMANISGYVGGDIVAGLSAYDIHEQEKNILFIDIGTNGEMALRSGGTTYACSTAAGPAFEGARISCGMRAATGAVSSVAFNGESLDIETIENAPARGLCGTGLLDSVAALLNSGIIDETGRFAEGSDLEKVPDEVKKNLTEEGYVLAEAPCDDCPKVILLDKDIRELQLAKGAVAAGFKSLLSLADLTEDKLDKIILAGAFGNFLRVESAQRVGLLPENFDLSKVEFVGNAALAGARAALLNLEKRRSSEKMAREIKYIELSGRADFQTFFMETMMFPPQ